MNIPSPASKRKARIEIIPLIDIVFFLLATFVMVSLSMVKNKGVNVNLPPASTGVRQQAKSDEYTAITIAKNGDIYFNKTRVNIDELPGRFKTLKAKEPDPTILLNGDDQAQLGRAVRVLDEARKLGIKKVAIQTKEPE